MIKSIYIPKFTLESRLALNLLSKSSAGENDMTEKNVLLVTLVLAGFGTLIDGIFTGVVLSAIIQPNNLLTASIVA